MLVRQGLRTLEYRRKVRFHELRHHVDVLEGIFVAGEEDTPNFDNIFVTQVAENTKFPKRAFGKRNVLERALDLLDRYTVVRLLVLCSANNAICSDRKSVV